MYCAYKVHWTEYERGWGQRPDGTTLHMNKSAADEYITHYLSSAYRGFSEHVTPCVTHTKTDTT